VLVNPKDDWPTQETSVLSGVNEATSATKLDAVINMAGGWAGGNSAADDFVKNCDLMWKQSVWSSAISARVAAKHLREGGLLVLPGAKPALAGTPGKRYVVAVVVLFTLSLLPLRHDGLWHGQGSRAPVGQVPFWL